MQTEHKITFFQRFEADILSGKKTITIRDQSESHYPLGSLVEVSTLEEGRIFAYIRIQAIEAKAFSELSEQEAEQENMSLEQLKNVIQEIYPGLEELYVIHYQLEGRA